MILSCFPSFLHPRATFCSLSPKRNPTQKSRIRLDINLFWTNLPNSGCFFFFFLSTYLISLNPIDYATYRGNKVYRGPITLSLVGKETMNVNCPPVIHRTIHDHVAANGNWFSAFHGHLSSPFAGELSSAFLPFQASTLPIFHHLQTLKYF